MWSMRSDALSIDDRDRWYPLGPCQPEGPLGISRVELALRLGSWYDEIFHLQSDHVLIMEKVLLCFYMHVHPWMHSGLCKTACSVPDFFFCVEVNSPRQAGF